MRRGRCPRVPLAKSLSGTGAAVNRAPGRRVGGVKRPAGCHRRSARHVATMTMIDSRAIAPGSAASPASRRALLASAGALAAAPWLGLTSRLCLAGRNRERRQRGSRVRRRQRVRAPRWRRPILASSIVSPGAHRRRRRRVSSAAAAPPGCRPSCTRQAPGACPRRRRRRSTRCRSARLPSTSSSPTWKRPGSTASPARSRRPTTAAKQAAQQAYQQALTKVAREAASRSLLRALYSPNQLQEQMTWFWFNHFNVHQYKNNLRVLVGDYEEQALRPHALGRFRDLLIASAHASGDDPLPRQRAERGRAHQRELRARADGAAHARRRRRLFAGGRAGAGPRAHRRGPQLQRQDAQRAAEPARALRPPGLHRVQPGPPRHRRQGRARPAIAGTRLERGARRAGAPRRTSGDRALHQPKLADYFVADEPPPRPGRAHGTGLRAQRWRHRRDARHDVRVA